MMYLLGQIEDSLAVLRRESKDASRKLAEVLSSDPLKDSASDAAAEPTFGRSDWGLIGHYQHSLSARILVCETLHRSGSSEEAREELLDVRLLLGAIDDLLKPTLTEHGPLGTIESLRERYAILVEELF